MKKFDRIIAGTLAGITSVSIMNSNFAEAKPLSRHFGEFVKPKLETIKKKTAELDEDLGSDWEAIQENRRQRALNKCEKSDYASKKCQKLLKKIRN